MDLVIHHLAFAADPPIYGSRTLRFLYRENEKPEDRLEDAFAVTNSEGHHIAFNEIKRRGVCYSTSVGDVISSREGRNFIVAGCGFRELKDFSALFKSWVDQGYPRYFWNDSSRNEAVLVPIPQPQQH